MVSAGEIHRDQHLRVGDSSHATVVSLQLSLYCHHYAIMLKSPFFAPCSCVFASIICLGRLYTGNLMPENV